VDHDLAEVAASGAAQQPPWTDPDRVRDVRAELNSQPPLVTRSDVRRLREDLAQVAAGRAKVIQTGDCAEDPAEATRDEVNRKAGLVEVLAGVLKMITQDPVVAAGRMAGQFGKPRSCPTQQVGDQELPVYRGHMVNTPEPDAESRKPDPGRMLSGYQASHDVMEHLGWTDPGSVSDLDVWTSHEALLLDYEVPMVRRDEAGELLLTSTHWPWIGERTRQVDGPHVELLASVANPVACKIGPTTSEDDVRGLCERLDPDRTPGRLTLISRMGADSVAERLPPLVAAVRAAGHPVIWLCDPMHGNTVNGPDGLKTRFLDTIRHEVQTFQDAVEAAGGVAGGLHLETVPDDVTECVENETYVEQVGERYTSHCDPRLNPGQAVAVVSAWRG
jgi:3-deoxy-7-phosphoheptulonate synthase